MFVLHTASLDACLYFPFPFLFLFLFLSVFRFPEDLKVEQATRDIFEGLRPPPELFLLRMDLFSRAKVVRLRSHHDKYLIAEDDESVIQDRNGACPQARWTVEFVDSDSRFVRLKSYYGRYLTASNKPFLLGLTGHKVIQDLPARLDSSVEWEPVREVMKIKLKTRYGNFLRANGGTYPYRNSITHDVPSRTATQDWVLWHLEVIEILAKMVPEPTPTTDSSRSRRKSQENINLIPSSASPPRPTRTSTCGSDEAPPAKAQNGRMINYHVADDEGNVDESYEGFSILFEGSSVQELSERLEEEMGMDGVIVCVRNVLTDQLSPLRLNLPPNNAKMNVVIVPSSSQVAEGFKEQGLI